MTTPGEHALGFHQGEVLLRLANTYDTLTLTLVEAVQNAIDALAEKVFIGIDIRNRMVVVYDDGQGVTEEKFREALLSVGKGVKDKGSLGRFGLGMISPINKCRVFTFISQPLGGRNVLCWTFAGEGIRTQHKQVSIPFERSTKLPDPPSQFAKSLRAIRARWRTIVHLEGVTEQKVVGLVDLDELEGHIRTKLGQGMLQKGTTVYVTLIDEFDERTRRTINPAEFKGEPLDVVEYDTDETGQVRLELYRALKSGGHRRGRVLVMQKDDNRPISWRDFQTQAMGLGWLDAFKEAFDALGSGYFEGIIQIEKVRLDPSGSKFDIAQGDAVQGSYFVIQRWFDDHGKDYYETERTQRREERYKDLAQQSLERLFTRFKSDPLFAGMVRGLVGLLPEQDVPETELRPERGPRDKAPAKPRKRIRVTVNQERLPADKPKSDAQQPPKGDPTRFTISFAYEILPDSIQLFEFDVQTGVLTFNILHPVWVMLDETQGKHTAKNDRQIMRLQEWLAFKVLLTLSQQGEAEFDNLVESIHQEVRFYAPLFIVG